jgi:hypothetical protein
VTHIQFVAELCIARGFNLLIVVMPVSIGDEISVDETVVISSLLESVNCDGETVPCKFQSF